MIKTLIKLILIWGILLGCSAPPASNITIRSRKTIIYEDSNVSTVIKSDELLPYDVWIDDSFIYVANGTKKTLSKIDIKTKQILKTFNFEGSCIGVTGDGNGNIYSLIHIGYYRGGQKILRIGKSDSIELVKFLDATGGLTNLLFSAKLDEAPGNTGFVVKNNNLIIPNGVFIDSLNLSDLKITKIAGQLSTINKQKPDKEGNALDVLMTFINDIDADDEGNLYFYDYDIRKLSNGYISTILSCCPNAEFGGKDGELPEARTNEPRGIAVDKSQNYIYFSEEDNTIRKISLKEKNVTTVAGNSKEFVKQKGTKTYVYGDYKDGKSNEAMFSSPNALAVDKYGDVYVADTGNHAIRKITFPKLLSESPSSSPTGAQ